MPPTPGMLLQMLQDNDDKHEDAHKRIRADIRGLELEVDDIRKRAHEQSGTITTMRATKTDVTNLSFSPRTVVAIVCICAGLASGQWALNQTLRQDVLKSVDSLKDTINELKRRQELQQYEIQGLKEEVLKQRKLP